MKYSVQFPMNLLKNGISISFPKCYVVGGILRSPDIISAYNFRRPSDWNLLYKDKAGKSKKKKLSLNFELSIDPFP